MSKFILANVCRAIAKASTIRLINRKRNGNLLISHQNIGFLKSINSKKSKLQNSQGLSYHIV